MGLDVCAQAVEISDLAWNAVSPSVSRRKDTRKGMTFTDVLLGSLTSQPCGQRSGPDVFGTEGWAYELASSSDRWNDGAAAGARTDGCEAVID